MSALVCVWASKRATARTDRTTKLHPRTQFPSYTPPFLCVEPFYFRGSFASKSFGTSLSAMIAGRVLYVNSFNWVLRHLLGQAVAFFLTPPGSKRFSAFPPRCESPSNCVMLFQQHHFLHSFEGAAFNPVEINAARHVHRIPLPIVCSRLQFFGNNC